MKIVRFCRKTEALVVIRLMLALCDALADSLNNLFELFQGANDPALNQLQFWLYRKVEFCHEFLVWDHVLKYSGRIRVLPGQVKFPGDWGEEGNEIIGKSDTCIEHG